MAGGQIEVGIDVKPGRVLEKLAQAAQHSPFVFVVKARVEYLRQLGCAHRQPNGPLGVAGQVGGEPVEAAEV